MPFSLCSSPATFPFRPLAASAAPTTTSVCVAAGHDLLDLVRAIRNICEHWFDVRDRRAGAVQALTGWGEADMRRGFESEVARGMQAAAVSRCFLGPFAELLLVFEFAKAWGSV